MVKPSEYGARYHKDEGEVSVPSSVLLAEEL